LYFRVELGRAVEILLDGLHGEVRAPTHFGSPERDGRIRRQVAVRGALRDHLDQRGTLRGTAGVLGGQCSEATRHDLMCFLFFVF
jgi:hypothetical protein